MASSLCSSRLSCVPLSRTCGALNVSTATTSQHQRFLPLAGAFKACRPPSVQRRMCKALVGVTEGPGVLQSWRLDWRSSGAVCILRRGGKSWHNESLLVLLGDLCGALLDIQSFQGLSCDKGNSYFATWTIKHVSDRLGSFTALPLYVPRGEAALKPPLRGFAFASRAFCQAQTVANIFRTVKTDLKLLRRPSSHASS